MIKKKKKKEEPKPEPKEVVTYYKCTMCTLRGNHIHTGCYFVDSSLLEEGKLPGVPRRCPLFFDNTNWHKCSASDLPRGPYDYGFCMYVPEND